MRTSYEVAQIIKRLREKRGWSLDELSRRVGVAKSTLSRYENGLREFPINDIGKYADVFGVTVEYLLGIEPETKRILVPLIGTICAGDGLLAEENIEDYVMYPFPKGKQPDFALRVRGNSMAGAGIEDGDIVYFRRKSWAEFNGQIVAVVLLETNEGMLKRIRWFSDRPQIELVPENQDYEKIVVTPDQIVVCGTYMGHFKPEKE